MAATDVLIYSDACAALKIDPSDGDTATELSLYVSAISQRLDTLVGPIVKRTVTAEVHDGGGVVLLKQYPVASVTTVSERIGTDTTALTASDYRIDLATGILYRATSGYDYVFAYGSANVTVTYVAGRFVDTESVEERYRLAAEIMLAHLWRKEHGMAAGSEEPQIPTFFIPRAVRELLSDQIQDAPAVA